MLTRFTDFRPKLTVFEITSMWLALDAEGCRKARENFPDWPYTGPFEVATWKDYLIDQKLAKVIIGRHGFERHAWRGQQVYVDNRPWV